jgi:hypothetical protein
MISKFIKNNKKTDFITVIDISDNYVSCFCYNIIDSTHTLIAVVKEEAKGFYNSEITNLEKALDCLEKVLDKAEAITKKRIKKTILNAPYIDTQSIKYPYMSNINNVVNKKDIKAINNLEMYEKILENDKFILSLNIQSIMLDGKKVENPESLYAKQLSADVTITTSFKPAIMNLVQICDYLDLEIVGIIDASQALPYFFSPENEHKAVIVDIDFNKTIFTSFNKTKITNTEVIPLGITNILSDVSKKLEVTGDSLLNFDFYKNQLTRLKGKVVHVSNNDSKYQIPYTDFYQAIELSLKDFFNTIFNDTRLSNISSEDIIHITGRGGEILLINDSFTKHINSNMILRKQIKKESIKNEIGLDDIKTIALFKYYLAKINSDAGLATMPSRLEKLNF